MSEVNLHDFNYVPRSEPTEVEREEFGVDIHSAANETVARAVAVIALAEEVDRKTLCQEARLSPSSVSKIIHGLREREVVAESAQKPIGGMPISILSKGRHFDLFVSANPAWQRAIELRALGQKLELGEEETTDYLIQLARATGIGPPTLY